MTFRKFLILSALLIFLLFTIFYAPVEMENGNDANFGLGLTQGELIQELVIVSGQNKLKFKKRREGHEGEDLKWVLDIGRKVQADQSLLAQIEKELKILSLRNPIPLEERDAELSVYGLDPPKSSVLISYQNETEEIRFGNLNAYTSGRYLLINGNLYLSDSRLFTLLTRDPNDYRDRTPVEFNDNDIGKVLISRDSMQIELSRKGKDWLVTNPYQDNADQSKVGELFRQLRSLFAVHFIDFISDDYKDLVDNFEAADFTVVLSLSSSPEKVRKIMINVEEIYSDDDDIGATVLMEEEVVLKISHDDTIYLLPDNPVRRLLPSLDYYRESRILPLASDGYRAIRIVKGDIDLELNYLSPDSWNIGGKSADIIFVRQYLEDLISVRAIGFLDLRLIDLKQPLAKLELQWQDLDQQLYDHRVQIYNYNEGKYLAVHNELRAYVIESRDFERLFFTAEQMESLGEGGLSTLVID